MATIKLGNSKSCSKSVDYAQKKAVVMGGVNCNPLNAKLEMKQVRVTYGKDDKVQAHTIIQSFKPNEISSELANHIGCQLAEKIAQGYQAVVYTHTDTEHIHNHIIINSVSLETGKKYHSDRGQIDMIRKASDDFCIENDLSIPIKPSNLRFTMAEKEILVSGKTSWKDELREAIDIEKQLSKNYESFKKELLKNYGIVIDDTRKHITFRHPDNDRVVRGKTLGADYEKAGIINGIIRQNKRTGQGIGERVGEVCGKSGTGQTKLGESSSKTSIGRVERELRKITDGVEQLTTDGRRKQEERGQQVSEQSRKDESISRKLKNTERYDDRTGREYSDGFER